MSFEGYLEQNSTTTITLGPFVDKDDGDTEKTGLTIEDTDVYLSKNGGAKANPNDTNDCTEDADGVYRKQLDGTDLNTKGLLAVYVHFADCLYVKQTYVILDPESYAGIVTGTAFGTDDKVLISTDAQDLSATLNVDTKTISGSGPAADNVESVFLGTGHTDDVDLSARTLKLDSDTDVAFEILSSDDSAIKAVSTASGKHGIEVTGNVAGAGVKATGGTAGPGIDAEGGASSGPGIKGTANANNDAGMELVKHGTGVDLDADDLAEVTAARMGALTDWINGGRLDTILDAAATATKLLKYVQLLTRSDAAIETDNGTELTEINADGGSGAGDYSAQNDSGEAVRDRGDAEWITATGFATAGDAMNLAADAIKAVSYDESTAFPVKSDDSGATQIARVGADGDTLETLSDQIDTAQTDLDTITGADGTTLATNQGNYAPAKAGDLMGLANDAITAAKYDETTAYPVKSDDSGSTEMARTGADGDTLETLSDQLDTAQTDLDTITGADGTTLATSQGNYAPAKAGDAMALIDDGITSAKYDENTAFPVKSADTGSTEIARTGADGDTLEDISDEIAALPLPEAPAKNVAFDFQFLMVDETDFATPETGLTVTGQVSKDLAAFGNIAGSIAERSNGIYSCSGAQADMNADLLTFRFSSAGAADTFVTIKTSS